MKYECEQFESDCLYSLTEKINEYLKIYEDDIEVISISHSSVRLEHSTDINEYNAILLFKKITK